MAAGDVVNSISGVNTLVSLIPAVGVEILITHTTTYGGGVAASSYYDGVNTSRYFYPQLAGGFISGTFKMWIKNSLGLMVEPSPGERHAYSGMQTK